MKDLDSFLNGLLADSGDTPDRLLQHLIAVQRRYSHIPEEAIQFLSERLQTPPVQRYSVLEYYAFLHRYPPGTYAVRFSANTNSHLLASQALRTTIC